MASNEPRAFRILVPVAIAVASLAVTLQTTGALRLVFGVIGVMALALSIVMLQAWLLWRSMPMIQIVPRSNVEGFDLELEIASAIVDEDEADRSAALVS